MSLQCFSRLGVLLISIFFLQTMNAQRSCGSLHPLSSNSIHDSDTKKKHQAFEKKIQEQILKKSSGVVTVIPVVFHIVHDGDQIGNGENISDAFINAQLLQLNDDFRRTNTDQSNTWSQAADTEIEFCLATLDPTGNATNGILRHNMQGGPWTQANFDSQVKPTTIWNRDQYLNIWSADLAGDLLGYAQFPSSSGASTDGVVCLSSSFGSLSTPQPAGNPFNLGRTLTHEVGHWLGLYHIWGDVSGCSGSDEVADTPNQEEDSSGCPSGTQFDACAMSGQGYMYQNYMDYSNDACMNLFTTDQMIRMKAAITEFRNGLNSSKCTSNVPLMANFNPSGGTLVVCPNEELQFIDLSTGSVLNRSWNFSGAGVSPTFSTAVNPLVLFTTSGAFDATLTVSNNVDLHVKQVFFNVDILDENEAACQAPPCLDFNESGGPYADLYNADGVFTNCEIIEVGFEVFSGEAYILPGLLSGTSYTLEFCNGYDKNLWDAVITIGEYDHDNEKAFPNSEIDYANDCSITFTPTTSDDYIAVISKARECNGILDERENGFLTFQCTNSLVDICGLEFVDDGGKINRYNINQDKVYTLCPSDTMCEKLSLIFSHFDLEDSPGCSSDYMIIRDGLGIDKEIIGTYCGANSPGMIISSASSGCLTIEIVSDDMTSFSEGWIASIVCLDDGSCLNECPDGYTLSGPENGTGGPLNVGEYYTNGSIFSIQSIESGEARYDANGGVCLDKEFDVHLNTSFSVYLNGCATGSGSKK